jgi:hypothetical protein
MQVAMMVIIKMLLIGFSLHHGELAKVVPITRN